MEKLGIIADDLSGACDTGAEFAARGLSCLVVFEKMSPEVDVDIVSISTETRQSSCEETRAKLVYACQTLAAHNARFIYKKIDSTLRGNCRFEIETLLEVLGLERAYIVPAFPEMGRRVGGGWLLVDDGSPPAQYIPSVLGTKDLQCIGSDDCSHERSLGKGLFVFDASTRDELRQVARFLWKRRSGSLLAGSAGLASELAELMIRESPIAYGVQSCSAEIASGPLIFVVGSTHANTCEQVERLIRSGREDVIALKRGWDASARRSLLHGRNVLLSLDCEHIDDVELAKLSNLATPGLAGGLVMTGGYAALVVCRMLATRAIRIFSNMLPGIPVGRLVGGHADGLLAVTKSGGFGSPDALEEIELLLHGERAA